MLLSATNIVKAKLINLWGVFEAIRIHGPLSRSEISDMTNLSKQAVSDLVDQLMGPALSKRGGSAGRA